MSSRGSEFEASEPEVESSGSELDTTSTFSIDSSLAGSSESESSSISVDSVSASGNGSTVPDDGLEWGATEGEDSLLDLLSSSGNESPNESFIYDAEPQHVPGGEDSRLYAGSTVSTFQALILIMQFALRYILAELHKTFTAIMLNLQNNCYVS